MVGAGHPNGRPAGLFDISAEISKMPNAQVDFFWKWDTHRCNPKMVIEARKEPRVLGDTLAAMISK